MPYMSTLYYYATICQYHQRRPYRFNPMILGLRTTIYRVGNLKDATQWYTQRFGQAPYFTQPTYIGFNIGGYELGLEPWDGDKAHAENVLTYWGVDDIEREFARFTQAGATAHQKPTPVGDDIVVATVRDPWGNIIGLIYNPHFSPSN